MLVPFVGDGKRNETLEARQQSDCWWIWEGWSGAEEQVNWSRERGEN